MKIKIATLKLSTLQPSLRLSARVADPLAQLARTGKEPSVGIDLSTAQPGWAVAFGLGLCPADL